MAKTPQTHHITTGYIRPRPSPGRDSATASPTSNRTTRSRIQSDLLANLLEGYRDEIVAAWVKVLYSMEDSHYREQPVTGLQHCSLTCINALAELFRTGSYDPLLAYSQSICEER